MPKSHFAHVDFDSLHLHTVYTAVVRSRISHKKEEEMFEDLDDLWVESAVELQEHTVKRVGLG